MTVIRGKWYDGRTSAAVPAVCRVSPAGAVQVTADADGRVLASLPRFDLRVSPPLGATPRCLYFPAGGKFETEDFEALEDVLAQFGRTSWLNAVHRLESRFGYVLLALALLIVFLWGGFRYGVPLLSRGIAAWLPPAAYRLAGEQTQALLERSVLGPSELDATTCRRLMIHFQPAIAAHPDTPVAILFRKGGPIGANAFALPDGRIIFTDEMVRLAAHDDELLAVLAHEIGHVVYRHGMRRVIQDSLMSFALLAITGDVSGSSELFLGLPVMLTEMAYSREFEREADRYALDFLRTEGVAPAHFAHLMARLDPPGGDGGGAAPKWTNYLSTHPLTEDRIRLFLQEAPAAPDAP